MPPPPVDVTEAYRIKEDQLLKMMAQCFSGILIATCRITKCHNHETNDNNIFSVILLEKSSDKLAKSTYSTNVKFKVFKAVNIMIFWDVTTCSYKDMF